MEISINYRGGKESETIICKDVVAHSSGGWMLIMGDSQGKSVGDIFLSSSDIRSFKLIRE